MKLLTITTWNNKLYREYAHKFESTYNWEWPYTVYNEDDGMFEAIPDLKKFVDRNKHRPTGNKGFLLDGVRFSYKVYAYCHAIKQYSNYDFIMGVDADSIFYYPMPIDVVKQELYREDCMMTYLGRGSQYSECGFLGFNMKHPEIQNYADEMLRMYNTDEIYTLKEYHDSFVWDHVRVLFEGKRQVQNLNIGDKKNAHVQARSVLGKYYDHTKGPTRKSVGYSGENSMVISRGRTNE
tara:strand:+ start:814 stop:1524 length:711 start_codon:yes stop_codon:yes gene_type:complete